MLLTGPVGLKIKWAVGCLKPMHYGTNLLMVLNQYFKYLCCFYVIYDLRCDNFKKFCFSKLKDVSMQNCIFFVKIWCNKFNTSLVEQQTFAEKKFMKLLLLLVGHVKIKYWLCYAFPAIVFVMAWQKKAEVSSQLSPCQYHPQCVDLG